MGISDELKASFGDEFFRPTADRVIYSNWREACVCGHLDRYHSESIGGLYRLKDTVVARGNRVVFEFTGCVGAMPGRSFEAVTKRIDPKTGDGVNTINPTCPCDRFRAVAKIDRPNRYYNQRLPRDRKDPARHPLPTGVRAFMTHLSRRKAAQTDPSWVDAEFARRFIWLDGARACAISQCTTVEGVWPVFVNVEGDSELRCAAHR